MNPDTRSLLLPFHFGAVDEFERLLVERELLTDGEVLTDYLDLKRRLEAASEIPQKPAGTLWLRLQPKTVRAKKVAFSFSLGLALAASFALFLIFSAGKEKKSSRSSSGREILFDTSRELALSSNVL